MKLNNKLLKIQFLLVFLLTSIPDVYATSYLSYSGFIGTIDKSTYCKIGTYGIKAYDTSSTCSFYVKIDLPDGSSISDVTVYFYDNSGSQTIAAYFYRTSFSSGSSSISYRVGSSSTTSSSVQSITPSPTFSSISSDYTYYLLVKMSEGTEYRGVKVTY